MLVVLALWQLAATLFPHRLFPAPLAVLIEIWQLATTGSLLADLGKTLTRVAIGFVAAMLIGTAIGIAVGRNRVLDRLLGPWLVVGLNLPAIVSAIALYIWLGLTEFALRDLVAGMQRLVRDLVQEAGATALLVTHVADDAVRLAHRAVLLRDSPATIAADLAFDVPPAQRTAVDFGSYLGLLAEAG